MWSRSTHEAVRNGRFDKVVRVWRRSKFVRIFVRNLILTILIEFVFFPVFGPLLGVSHLEQDALDLMMRFFSNTDRIQYRDIPAAFTLLDIDEASMEAWGDPPLTPREKVLDLIRFSTQNGARLVVVDSNFLRSYRKFRPDFASVEDSLQTFLSEYGKKADAPPIVLVRPNSFEGDQQGSACPRLQRSFFDEGTFSPDRVQWAAVRFDIDGDYVLRRWRLFEQLCDVGRPLVVPSVQLAVAANLAGAAGVSELNHWLLQFRPQSCTACSGDAQGLLGWRSLLDQLAHGRQQVDTLRLQNIQIEPDTNEVEQRILFRLPYMSSAERRSYAPVQVQNQSAPTPVLDVLSAQKFLEVMEKTSSTERLRGRIVFIGFTFHDSGDWFATPIGRMPGVMVLINATYSLLEYGHLHEKSPLRELIDLLVLVTGMTLIFSFVHGVWGLVLSTLLVIVYLVPNSFVLFQQGRWLDFVAPLIGVELHHLVDFFLERYNISRKSSPSAGEGS